MDIVLQVSKRLLR